MEKLFILREMKPGTTREAKPLEDEVMHICRNERTEQLPEAGNDGMRRIRITDDAYRAAMELGQRLRKNLHGYKPDVSLVASALILDGCRTEYSTEVKEVIGNFVIELFKSASE